MPVFSTDAVPRPKLVLAVGTLFKSLRLFDIDSFVLSVPITLVSCEPSIAGSLAFPSN